jgi:hypothetical protein
MVTPVPPSAGANVVLTIIWPANDGSVDSNLVAHYSNKDSEVPTAEKPDF